jgi:hypothetical protein
LHASLYKTQRSIGIVAESLETSRIFEKAAFRIRKYVGMSLISSQDFGNLLLYLVFYVIDFKQLQQLNGIFSKFIGVQPLSDN